MIDEPSVDEAKDLYAHFGLAFYCSSVLEHGIANAILILELLEGRGGAKTLEMWEALVDKHFEESFEKTLGQEEGVAFTGCFAQAGESLIADRRVLNCEPSGATGSGQCALGDMVEG
jgi:hypothetical protein